MEEEEEEEEVGQEWKCEDVLRICVEVQYGYSQLPHHELALQDSHWLLGSMGYLPHADNVLLANTIPRKFQYLLVSQIPMHVLRIDLQVSAIPFYIPISSSDPKCLTLRKAPFQGSGRLSFGKSSGCLNGAKQRS